MMQVDLGFITSSFFLSLSYLSLISLLYVLFEIRESVLHIGLEKAGKKGHKKDRGRSMLPSRSLSSSCAKRFFLGA